MPKVVNLMEDVVKYFMEDMLDYIRVCNCEQCLKDITACALNDLPPKYFISEKGRVYSKVELLKQQLEVDIISAITKASVIVKKYPRH